MDDNTVSRTLQYCRRLAPCMAVSCGVHSVRIASYSFALYPTKNVSPICSVGARRFPLRPITALTMVSRELASGLKTSTSLPRATWMNCEVLKRSQTSVGFNFTLRASVLLRTSMSFASRNSCAFRHDVQLFLK